MTGTVVYGSTPISDHLRAGGLFFGLLGLSVYCHLYYVLGFRDGKGCCDVTYGLFAVSKALLALSAVMVVIAIGTALRRSWRLHNLAVGIASASSVLVLHAYVMKNTPLIGIELGAWGAFLYLMSFVARRVTVTL